jgi:hypothetical protein
MRKFWRLIVRVVFWSYERGSLPYDLMVIAILIFVLLTPRKWYHDQPNQKVRPVSGQIRLLNVDPASQTEVFRIDASLLVPPGPALDLQSKTHALLGQNVSSLRNETFQVVQIDPVRAADGSLTGYDVKVKPSGGATP